MEQLFGKVDHLIGIKRLLQIMLDAQLIGLLRRIMTGHQHEVNRRIDLFRQPFEFRCPKTIQ